MYLCNLNVKGFYRAGMHLCERKGEHESDLKTDAVQPTTYGYADIL